MFPTKESDPIAAFNEWFAEASACDAIDHPESVNVATATPAGVPSSRIVYLKHVDERGFVFYTNYGSRKAAELEANPYAAMCFFWQPLGKQVRVTGKVERVSVEESDEYFASRAKQSQIGAWASKQSQPISSKKELLVRVAKKGLKYNIGTVPRPDFWGGYRVIPTEIEFWDMGDFRIHDRLTFIRAGDAWQTTRLFP
jgi:pyridoxamine 5'-phosphate oxidase